LWRVAAIAALVSVSAGGRLLASPGEFVRVAQTKHISFYAVEGGRSSVSPGRCERFLARVAQQLGVELGDEDQVAYYRLTYPEQVVFYTGIPDARYAGWANRDVVYSVLAFHRHELVHVIALRIGDPGRFFQEGLAIALGDKQRRGAEHVDRVARACLSGLDTQTFEHVVEFDDDVAPEIAYPLAGSFMRYLIKQHGPSAVVRFFRGCPDARHRDTAFASVFGLSLQDALSRWCASLQSTCPVANLPAGSK
jgi:hypothetical protein